MRIGNRVLAVLLAVLDLVLAAAFMARIGGSAFVHLSPGVVSSAAYESFTGAVESAALWLLVAVSVLVVILARDWTRWVGVAWLAAGASMLVAATSAGHLALLRLLVVPITLLAVTVSPLLTIALVVAGFYTAFRSLSRRPAAPDPAAPLGVSRPA